MMFLDLMPVVEKPEIVQAKEQKLKSLGSKYIVLSLIFISNIYQNSVIILRVNAKLMVVDLFSSVALLSI